MAPLAKYRRRRKDVGTILGGKRTALHEVENKENSEPSYYCQDGSQLRQRLWLHVLRQRLRVVLGAVHASVRVGAPPIPAFFFLRANDTRPPNSEFKGQLLVTALALSLRHETNENNDW